MEVKKGYRQTEVGIIPNNWTIHTIDSVCRLINGRGFKPFEWKKEGLPIIRIQNLNGSDEYNYYQGSYDRKLEIENGQLLFAWSGSRGTSFGPHIWKGEKGLLNYHTWKVAINERKIDKNFFFHSLKNLTKQIEDGAHGASALVHTQKWVMEKMEFPCPPTKAEQTAIATALTETDTLIDKLEKIIEKKRNIKQGSFQKLLKPKQNWQKRKLGNIATIQKGQIITRKQAELGHIPVIAGGIKPSYYHNKANRKKNTITISASGANAGYVGFHSYPIFASDCSTIEVSNEYDVRFLYFLLKFKQNEIFNKQTGGAQPHIYPEQLKLMDVEIPNEKEEQSEIASILLEIEGEIARLESKWEKYKQIMQGMMQQLLTGKTRLI